MPYGQGRNGEGCRGGRGGLLEPAVLAALTTATSHGYDLRAAVAQMTAGFLVVDPGGLYRALRRMEEDGLAISAWTEGDHGPQRRTYQITADGRDLLAVWAERLSAQRTAIDAILRTIEGPTVTDERSGATADSTKHEGHEEQDNAAR